jgi:hypothetical protein
MQRLSTPSLVGTLATNGVIIYFAQLSVIDWYLTVAGGSSLVLAFASLVGDLEEHPQLISARPTEFLNALEEILLRPALGWEAITWAARRPPFREFGGFCDWVAAQALTYVGGWALVIWQFAFAPLLYPAYLVLGAPARVMRNQTATAYKSEDGNTWVVDPDGTEVPEGARNISFHARPVTTTLLLTAIILWFTKIVV